MTYEDIAAKMVRWALLDWSYFCASSFPPAFRALQPEEYQARSKNKIMCELRK